MEDITKKLNLTTEEIREIKKERKKKKKEAARAKRNRFIGKAKAVDRGQFLDTYCPGGKTGIDFTAKSGLPFSSTKGELFTVLGIESSCDDTGGKSKLTKLLR